MYNIDKMFLTKFFLLFVLIQIQHITKIVETFGVVTDKTFNLIIETGSTPSYTQAMYLGRLDRTFNRIFCIQEL